MRKISKTRMPDRGWDVIDTDPGEARPLRIAGATITSWPGAAVVDLDTLFARPVQGETVAAAGADKQTRTLSATVRNAETGQSPADRHAHATVSLSDGTRITFTTAGQFENVE